MTTSVIVAGARTPFGSFLGSLKTLTATELGGIAIQGALQKAHLDPSMVDYVIMGQVLTAGAGQIPARQAAIAAGIPWTVPALTINKVCLSGIDAIALADQLIRAGEFEVIVAGGQESMTGAPHFLPHSRNGYRYGDITVKDHLAYDGLTDIYTQMLMGALTEECNKTIGQYSRTQQDEFACQSHHKAAQAWKDHVFDDEVVPVRVTTKKTTTEFCYDECIREATTLDSLAQLKPVFDPHGTITAGSASPISDGAAAVIVMSKTKAEQLGLSWLCEIGAHGVVAGPDSTLQLQPANAIIAATTKEGITPAQCDLVEINEAFAAVGLASMDKLGLDPAKVNIHGGAIAIGHPLATSGARMVLHLALQLATRPGGYAVAALCGGGGQGDALILRG